MYKFIKTLIFFLKCLFTIIFCQIMGALFFCLLRDCFWIWQTPNPVVMSKATRKMESKVTPFFLSLEVTLVLFLRAFAHWALLEKSGLLFCPTRGIEVWIPATMIQWIKYEMRFLVIPKVIIVEGVQSQLTAQWHRCLGDSPHFQWG